MLELFTVLVLAALRVRVEWALVKGRLRVKSILVEWSPRRPR
jgi:hypothetical protein